MVWVYFLSFLRTLGGSLNSFVSKSNCTSWPPLEFFKKQGLDRFQALRAVLYKVPQWPMPCGEDWEADLMHPASLSHLGNSWPCGLTGRPEDAAQSVQRTPQRKDRLWPCRAGWGLKATKHTFYNPGACFSSAHTWHDKFQDVNRIGMFSGQMSSSLLCLYSPTSLLQPWPQGTYFRCKYRKVMGRTESFGEWPFVPPWRYFFTCAAGHNRSFQSRAQSCLWPLTLPTCQLGQTPQTLPLDFPESLYCLCVPIPPT